MSRSKCSYADKYRAHRAPTCGCDTCLDIWENFEERAAIIETSAEVSRKQAEKQARRLIFGE